MKKRSTKKDEPPFFDLTFEDIQKFSRFLELNVKRTFKPYKKRKKK